MARNVDINISILKKYSDSLTDVRQHKCDIIFEKFCIVRNIQKFNHTRVRCYRDHARFSQ